MNIIFYLFELYIWIALAILLFFLSAIARFYEKKAGQRSYYQAFIVSILLFGAATIRYLFTSPLFIGDFWGAGLRLLASIVVIGFGVFLLNLMTGGRA